MLMMILLAHERLYTLQVTTAVLSDKRSIPLSKSKGKADENFAEELLSDYHKIIVPEATQARFCMIGPDCSHEITLTVRYYIIL